MTLKLRDLKKAAQNYINANGPLLDRVVQELLKCYGHAHSDGVAHRLKGTQCPATTNFLLNTPLSVCTTST